MNTGLNYALIFGHLGFPALDVTGAAIASVISQLVNMALMLAVFRMVRLRGQRDFRFSLSLGTGGYRQYLMMRIKS